MEFDKIIEEWASKYKPILHVPGERSTNMRFFLVDSILNIPQLAANLNIHKSPCVTLEFHEEGELEGSTAETAYTVGILVKVSDMNMVEKTRAREAVKEAFVHVQKLIAWLRVKRETDRSLQMLDLEHIHYDTFGPLYNNWYQVYITIGDVQNRCVEVDPNDYIE